jgi:hypothetical protein
MTQPLSSSLPPVIAIPPAAVTHVVKAVLGAIPAGALGWAAYLVAASGTDIPDAATKYGLCAGIVAVALLIFLVTVRNMRALFVKPEMILTPDGFRVSSWRGVGFLGIFLPYYRMKQHVVPWEDFVESVKYTHKVNGITMDQELRLTIKGVGLIAFGWDVFKPSVEKMQRTILDYIDERFRAPKRAEGRLAEFQRKRWMEPLVIRGDNVPLWLVLAFWALTAGFAVAVYRDGAAHDWVGFCAVCSLIIAFMLTQHWRKAERCRHVALTADGLSVGPNAMKCRVVPWDDIRFVRAHTNANARNSKIGNIERLEVRLGNGQAVMIEGWNQKDYQRLVAFLEPPLNGLSDAWAQLAQGKSAESAAQAAGLQARS